MFQPVRILAVRTRAAQPEAQLSIPRTHTVELTTQIVL